MADTHTCTICGEPGVPIVYGMPPAELGEAEERGEFVLGGCVVTGEDPDHRCSYCGHEWRAKQRAKDQGARQVGTGAAERRSSAFPATSG
jgi:hypothetical protein